MSKRQVQRLRLERPIEGRLGPHAVKVLNISLRGALVETRGALRVGTTIEFVPQVESDVRLQSLVRRCELVRHEDEGEASYHVAVSYPHSDLESQSMLRQLLIDLLRGAIEIMENQRKATVLHEFGHQSPHAVESLFPSIRREKRGDRL